MSDNEVQDLFSSDKLLARAVDTPSLTRTAEGIAYDFSLWEEYREGIDAREGTSLSTTLLVKGEKVQTYKGIGFLINSDKVEVFHINKQDNGSHGDIKQGNFSANPADFATLPELAEQIRKDHLHDYNECKINMESTDAYVGLFAGSLDRQKAFAILAQQYYYTQTGKELPIYVYDYQASTLTPFKPTQQEKEDLFKTIKSSKCAWETSDGEQKCVNCLSTTNQTQEEVKKTTNREKLLALSGRTPSATQKPVTTQQTLHPALRQKILTLNILSK